MKYTVILLRPDYIVPEMWEGLYTDHVEADSPQGALDEARTRVVACDYGTDAADAVPADYLALAVFAGHLDDVNPE